MRSTSEVPAEVKVVYRRRTLGEAVQSACVVFASVNLLHVVWDFVRSAPIDFGYAFVQALCFGVGCGIAGMVFKSKAVWLR